MSNCCFMVCVRWHDRERENKRLHSSTREASIEFGKSYQNFQSTRNRLKSQEIQGDIWKDVGRLFAILCALDINERAAPALAGTRLTSGSLQRRRTRKSPIIPACGFPPRCYTMSAGDTVHSGMPSHFFPLD